MISSDKGYIYQGMFHNNMKHGKGIINYSNGNKYAGYWV
jgi:hypothetical protein